MTVMPFCLQQLLPNVGGMLQHSSVTLTAV